MELRSNIIRSFYLLPSLIFMFLSVTILNIYSGAYALSPSFERRITFDEPDEWIELNSFDISKKAIPSTDILGVSYFSDGKILNSTLWLAAPFNATMPSSEGDISKLAYGIMIDVDFDDLPDFRFELQKFQNRNWSKVYREFEPIYNTSFSTERVANKFFNYEPNLSERSFPKNQRYVNLPVELNLVGDPKQYQFYFYSEMRKLDLVLDDFTKWVAIPPPEIKQSLIPNSLEIRPNEIKNINIRVNSTTGYEPQINLYAKNTTELKLYFDLKGLEIPSFGTAAIPFKVKAIEDATPSTIDIPIAINSSTPPKVLYEGNSSSLQNDDLENFSPQARETIEQISVLSVEVKDPYNIFELLSKRCLSIKYNREQSNTR
jgi:hypothetical protein